jgi:hypothetical protein
VKEKAKTSAKCGEIEPTSCLRDDVDVLLESSREQSKTSKSAKCGEIEQSTCRRDNDEVLLESARRVKKTSKSCNRTPLSRHYRIDCT